MSDEDVKEFMDEFIDSTYGFKCYDLPKFDESIRQVILNKIGQFILDNHRDLDYEKIYHCLGCAMSLGYNELIDIILSLPEDYTSPPYPDDDDDYLRKSLEDGSLDLFNKIVESIKKRKNGE